MVTTVKPEREEDVLSVVTWAAAEHKPLEIVGGGTKTGVGRPIQAEHRLDLSELTGISLYEPEELVMTAKAGTSVAAIETLLAENGQELAFEPPNLNQFFGLEDQAEPTIGGVIASNLSGPRRIRSGAARDHFLGLKLVSGRGEAIFSGGRVMKNVTGYDLCKGLAGSWGTLGVLTEVSFKVLPAAEVSSTLLLFGQSPEEAVTSLSASLGSPADVSGAVHLPPAAAARSKVARIKNCGTSVTAIRIEGFAASVKARQTGLEALMERTLDRGKLANSTSQTLWSEIRDLSLLPRLDDNSVIWRISTAPTHGPPVARALGTATGADAVFDWGGGLVWLVQPAMGNGNAAAVRTVLETHGGHATLYRAPLPLRTTIDVFHPQPGAVAALTNRLKAAFDPHGVLNPNRMYPRV